VVSMDEKPLSESARILVQTGTVYRPSGWKEVEETYMMNGDSVQGFRIVDTGRMPWVADPTRVKMFVSNPGITRALLLDMAGYPVRELKLKRSGNRVEVDLPPDALYVVLSGQ